MARLTQRRMQMLLDCLGEIYAQHDLDSFTQISMKVGRKLVASDYAIFEEMNPRRKRHQWVTDPAGMELPGPSDAPEAHKRYFQEHPMVERLSRTGDLSAVRMSDFMTRREYHESWIYREVFRRFGVEAQLGFSLPAPASHLRVGQALHRSHGDFSEEDRFIFELLRPHLFRAYHNADLITQLRQANAQMETALETASQGVVTLDVKGRIQFCSPRARQWLTAHFAPARTADRLPAPVIAWLRLQRLPSPQKGLLPVAPRPFTVEGPESRLTIHRVAGSVPGQQMLLLEERRTALSPALLQRLGLSRREAEVLVWVAQGKTNPEIGIILGLSAGTVHKHTEHIFAKLGVETRTAAAQRAFEAFNLDSST